MKRPPRPSFKALVVGSAGSALVLVLAVLVGYVYLKAELPSIQTAADYVPRRATKVYSDDGELVGELFLERRTVVPIEAIPKHVVHAFLAAEDASFYQHEGIDWLGVARAAIKNLRPGAHPQGASTITQQTVKTIIVGPERSYARKMREAILSREMEQKLHKDEILYLYLNQIYFGGGAYGVEEAARTYFGKSVRDLDVGEAALLASVPKNPSHYNIAADPEAAKGRQKYVLEQMQSHGFIDAMAVKKALDKPLYKPPAQKYVNVGPQYLEHVRTLLVERYGEDKVLTGGMTVYLGMSARMQDSAKKALRSGLEGLTRTQGWPGAPLRIEVDKLARYKKALHEAFDDKKKKQLFYGGAFGKKPAYVWDLARVSDKDLVDETELADDVRAVPLAYGLRLTALVAEVDPVSDDVWVDLGSQQGRIDFKTLAWARRFAPGAGTPEPRDPSDILRPGDLVQVHVVGLPGPSSPKIKTVQLELVPEPKAEGALVAIDPHTRLVRAMVGGYRGEAGTFNRALLAKRQPGSAFKPFVYAAGLTQGAITPASTCADSPVVIRDQWTGEAWKPENYEDGRFDGNITYRTALMRSKNTCSVKLIERVGPEAVMTLAKAAGIESPQPQNMTLALGTGDVTPLELVNGYASIAAGGYYAPPIFIRKVVDADGTVLEETQSEPVKALEPAVAYVLTQMMRSVVEEGTATKALVLDRPLAGKTGTSQQSRNVWFCGFSAELVAGVWVGFDDNAPLGKATGGSAALPIWIDFMGNGLSGVPVREFVPPADVVFVKVDADTGEPSDGVGAIEQAFVVGSEPSKQTQALPSIFIEDDARPLGPN